MTDKKVTTGEVVGSLRTMARLFKQMEFANEAAELVLKAEATVKKLKTEVEVLSKEKEGLNKDCDEIVRKTNLAEETFKGRQNDMNNRITQMGLEGDAIKNKATTEARIILEKAQAEVQVILDRVSTAATKEKAAKAAQAQAEDKLVSIEKQVKKAKDAFMSAVG